MHFLKCNQCGHFNDIKSEYLVFCSKCGKKLNNNYPDWKKRNPDKSFDDFKQLFCTMEKNEPSLSISKQKDSKKRKKQLYGILSGICIIVIIVIFTLFGRYGGEKFADWIKQPSIDKALMDIASEINKMCPIMIDSYTQLDNVEALPNKIFQYNYTIINMVKDSIDLYEMKEYLEPTIVNFVSTSSDLQFARDNDLTVNYYYKDMDGMYLFTISVTPEKYKQLIAF